MLPRAFTAGGAAGPPGAMVMRSRDRRLGARINRDKVGATPYATCRRAEARRFAREKPCNGAGGTSHVE